MNGISCKNIQQAFAVLEESEESLERSFLVTQGAVLHLAKSVKKLILYAQSHSVEQKHLDWAVGEITEGIDRAIGFVEDYSSVNKLISLGLQIEGRLTKKKINRVERLVFQVKVDAMGDYLKNLRDCIFLINKEGTEFDSLLKFI